MIPSMVAAAALALTSDDFRSGGTIPAALMAAQCRGSNRRPVLRWANVPTGVRSFALIERDPDAPIPGGFYHWVVYDVPAGTRSLGASDAGRTGVSSTGQARYFGPCPPPGPAHHYVFTLYALDVAHVGAAATLTGPQLEADVRGHILARATLEGTAAR